MTRQRDIGRVLDAWLAPGPTEAPDRILDILADRIAEVPQRRYPRAHTRFHAMTPPTIKFAAAAAFLLAIGVAIGPLVNTAPNVASSPAPSASVEPISTAVPVRLVYDWFYGPGADPSGSVTDSIRLSIDKDSLLVSGAGLQQGLRATSPQPGVIDLVALTTGPCPTAMTGRYGWSLSPGGTKLVLSVIDDACAQRVAALEHEYLRLDCSNPDDPCLGEMEAGSYHTVDFAPGPSSRHSLAFDVPEGWSNVMDGPARYELVLTEAVTSGAVEEFLPWDQHLLPSGGVAAWGVP